MQETSYNQKATFLSGWKDERLHPSPAFLLSRSTIFTISLTGCSSYPSTIFLVSPPSPSAQTRLSCLTKREWGFNYTVEYTHDSSLSPMITLPSFGLFFDLPISHRQSSSITRSSTKFLFTIFYTSCPPISSHLISSNLKVLKDSRSYSNDRNKRDKLEIQHFIRRRTEDFTYTTSLCGCFPSVLSDLSMLLSLPSELRSYYKWNGKINLTVIRLLNCHYTQLSNSHYDLRSHRKSFSLRLSKSNLTREKDFNSPVSSSLSSSGEAVRVSCRHTLLAQDTKWVSSHRLTSFWLTCEHDDNWKRRQNTSISMYWRD